MLKYPEVSFERTYQNLNQVKGSNAPVPKSEVKGIVFEIFDLRLYKFDLWHICMKTYLLYRDSSLVVALRLRLQTRTVIIDRDTK